MIIPDDSILKYTFTPGYDAEFIIVRVRHFLFLNIAKSSHFLRDIHFYQLQSNMLIIVFEPHNIMWNLLPLGASVV